ncbi:monothiol bacilliredoxin BrxC family protein, partial [Bacillus safensis]
MSKQLIETEEQFDQLTNQDGTFVFFKHSLTCPISQAAF